LNLLSALFGAAVRIRNELYDNGTLTARRLKGPVVSIGNIALGGSGKTPFLILLGELLKQRGISFDVLSRGYGRKTEGVMLVDPQGAAREFGDEPVLIASKLGVPVIVGEDRFLAGQCAEQKFGPRLHLLDDGFQHRKLARDFDIVLLTAPDSRDSLLPAGRLREPMASLARADAIVLSDGVTSLKQRPRNKQLWRVRRAIVLPEVMETCVAFCGVARPAQFFDQLRVARVPVAAKRAFRDHHAYTEADVEQLVALRKRRNATAFVTTEKDAVNLGRLLDSLGPVRVASVHMELENSAAAVDVLLATIAQRTKWTP